MKRNVIYIIIIALLLATTIFYWQRARQLSYRLSLIQERIEQSKREMEQAKREAAEKEKREGPVYKAKVAIVLDDWGYNVNNLKDVWALQRPITLSILPNLPYSRRIAEVAEKKGIEVILHLPLEPYENVRLEEGTIMTEMTDEEVLGSLENSISSVPNLRGISNHMGSKATEDERVMSIIFGRMKDDGLYFLDSLVTNKSVCRRLSRGLGVKFVNRSVFLDNESDAEYIKGQIEELAREALGTDWAVGVGHDRALTIAVIKEMLPLLEGAGIEVVPLSELAE